jgi:hypothetical protein
MTNLKRKFFTVLSLMFLSLALAATAQGEEAPSPWRELNRPGNEKGLFMDPRLLSMGSRAHMVWSGTNDDVRKPEVFHSSIEGDSTEWKSPRAPFFGQNKGRVRKLALGKTRNLIGLFFQRSLTQGNDAYEVLLAISSDQGWSWSSTIEIDSYVAEKTGGTAVGIEGRQGSNRPEFALAWVRQYGNVRAANFDISSTLRPEGSAVGEATEGTSKVEVGALGRDGFTVVFNNGVGLASAHVKALIGTIAESQNFLRGRFGDFFSVASRPYGPSRLAVGTGETLEAFTADDTKWVNDEQSVKLPFPSTGVMAETDLDDNKNLHVAILRPADGAFELWYAGQKDKVWIQPELVHTFDDELEMRGFDIAATDDFVYLAASQGFKAKFFRRNKPKK